MKVTTGNNVKQFSLSRIKAVYIGFDDNTEVTLNQIVDYDIDLDRIDCSTIEFTNTLDNVEIENHFSKNSHIICVRIDGIGYLPDSDKETTVFYDIPCDMKIRRLRMNGDIGTCQNMFVGLEGIVK